MHNEAAIHHDARAEEIEPALSRRLIRIGRAPQRWFHHVLLLLGGSAETPGNAPGEPLIGPSLSLFPPSEGESLSIAAGTHGYLIGISPEIIGEAIGDHAESVSLRLFSGSYSSAERLDAAVIGELTPLFTGFLSELQQQGRAARMAVAAYARLILMACWRLHGADDTAAMRPNSNGAILQRFRQSVEMNYRLRRPIGDYAEELGITTDRLHAICQRTLSRSPLELVHDRLLQEAKLRLERAGHSVQNISDSLGFRDPANFSHFFKRKTGVSPMKYRNLAASANATIPLSSGYADWP